jgi:hypothetical protein
MKRSAPDPFFLAKRLRPLVRIASLGLLTWLLTPGCMKPADLFEAAPKINEESDQAATARPLVGYLAADRVERLSRASTGHPPPPVIGHDPKQVQPSQPENVTFITPSAVPGSLADTHTSEDRSSADPTN